MDAQTAPHHSPIMPLPELVQRYLALAGAFGNALPLSALALAVPELERLFSAYDEDYHISRFFHFSNSSGTAYTIDSEPVTHIAIDAEINAIL